MNRRNSSALLVSDFNVEGFRALFANDPGEPGVTATCAPFGEVYPALLGNNLDDGSFDFGVVWTRPEGVSKAFQQAVDGRPFAVQEILAQVDQFAAALARFAGRVHHLFVPTWVVPPHRRGFSLFDMQNHAGASNLVMRMNLRLCDALQDNAAVFVLNTSKWIENAGGFAMNPKSWFLGRIAFGPEVFKDAVSDIKGLLNAASGRSRKLILLDLDDTLWGGTVGEDGWQNLRLGGHDPQGEAFLDFQRQLKILARRGVLLGIVSKNEENVAIEAIQRHPEMVLRVEDFAGWRINWADKAENIAALLAELNLTPAAAVFLDNDPAERDRVRRALPEVLVPDWPADKMLYSRELWRLRCFPAVAVSAEDRSRQELYAIKRQGDALKTRCQSVDEWLASLQLVLTVEEAGPESMPRVLQLLNKTNQMNLSTRRLSAAELSAWLAGGRRELWTVRVKDRFGDSGLAGLFSLEIQDTTAQLIDFVLSCRVLGRRVEECMVRLATEQARRLGAGRLRAQCLPTPKNKPCLDFWQNLAGFACDPETTTYWRELDAPLPEVPHVTIERSPA